MRKRNHQIIVRFDDEELLQTVKNFHRYDTLFLNKPALRYRRK